MQADRHAFAERMRLQLAARYHGVDVSVDEARFAVHLQGSGIDTTLPLAPLHHSVQRQPGRTAELIAAYVRSVEQQLTPRVATTLAGARVLWCVRSQRYLDGLTRSADLLTVALPARLVAFAAEELPGSIMRGVPRDEWDAAGITDDALRQSASANTDTRFASIAARIRNADRIPGDGWRMSADPMFQGSVLMAPSVLGALVQRSGGDVLLGVPDRGVVLAQPAGLPSADRFGQRVTREYREAMNPCSTAVLVSDGVSLRERQRGPRLSAAVMPWLES